VSSWASMRESLRLGSVGAEGVGPGGLTEGIGAKEGTAVLGPACFAPAMTLATIT